MTSHVPPGWACSRLTFQKAVGLRALTRVGVALPRPPTLSLTVLSALLETLMTLFLEGPVLLDPSRAPYPAAGESSTPPWASQHKRRPLCPAVRRAWAVRLVTARLKDPLRVTGSLSSWLMTRAPLPHLQTALLCHPSMEAAWPLTTPEVSAKDKNDSAPLANGL